MRTLLAIALAALVAFAVASHGWDIDEDSHWEEPLDVDNLCEQVGELSGCSGCFLGTKGLCTWLSHDVAGVAKKKRDGQLVAFPSNPIHYHCEPTARAKELLDGDGLDSSGTRWINASSLCPRDPTKEPIVRETYDGEADLLLTESSFKRTSIFKSTWVDSDLSDLPVRPYPVDRTSFYGSIGSASSLISNEAHIDCQDLHSLDLIAEELDNGSVEDSDGSLLLTGGPRNEQDKYCVRLALAGYLSTRCPEYGVAVSGICQSFYDKIQWNCGGSRNLDSSNVQPQAYTFESIEFSRLLESTYVVPDDTAFCIDHFHIKASGHMEHLAGLDLSIEDLEEEHYDYDD